MGDLGAAGAAPGGAARGAPLHQQLVLGVPCLAARRLLQDGLRQLTEGQVDVCVIFRRGLHERYSVFLTYLQIKQYSWIKVFTLCLQAGKTLQN